VQGTKYVFVKDSVTAKANVSQEMGRFLVSDAFELLDASVPAGVAPSPRFNPRLQPTTKFVSDNFSGGDDVLSASTGVEVKVNSFSDFFGGCAPEDRAKRFHSSEPH
jgi:hypothetical protein